MSRIILVLIVTGILSGCVLLNPHVTSEKLMKLPEEDATRFHGTLPQAIAGVNDLRWRYINAVGEMSSVQNTIGAALIPLTAFALYRGITSSGDGTQRILAKVGLAGAAGYAFSSTYGSRPRQSVYLAGADALGCLVVATRPFLYETKDWGTPKTADRNTFLGAVELLASRADSLSRLVAVSPALPEVAEAQKSLEIARTVLGKARTLRAQVDIAGTRLREKALEIQNQVSAEVLKTEPDATAIFKALDSIRENAFRFSGSSLLAPKTGDSTKAEAKLTSAEQQAQSRLVIAINEVKDSIADVESWLAQAAALSAEVTSLSQCKLTVPGFSLKVFPDVSEVTLQPGELQSFNVSGGSGIPRAALIGRFTKSPKDVATLDIKVDQSGTYVATITLLKGATENDQPVVAFSDGSGNLNRSINVIVQAGGAKEEPKKESAPIPSFADQLGEKEIQTIQQKLGASGPEQTGKVDEKTKAAVKNCQTRLTLKNADGNLNDETRAAIVQDKCSGAWTKP